MREAVLRCSSSFLFSVMAKKRQKPTAQIDEITHPDWKIQQQQLSSREREREEKWFSCIIDEASWRSRKTNFNQNQIVPPCLSRYVDGESSAPHVGSARLYGDSLLLPDSLARALIRLHKKFHGFFFLLFFFLSSSLLSFFLSVCVCVH